MKVSNSTIPQLFSRQFRIAALAFVGLMIAFPVLSSAHTNSQPQWVQLKAEALHCAAEDMRDEIKTHFPRSRVYRNMLATNARIKIRSAAVARRVKRDPCYGGLERDLRKLDEWVHELHCLFDEAIERNIQCLDKPIVGDIGHVADKIGGMIDLTHCIMAAANGQVEVILEPSIYSSQPALFEMPNEFGSKFDRYRPNIDVAPGVPSVEAPTPRLEAPHVTEVYEKSEQIGKSVLRK